MLSRYVSMARERGSLQASPAAVKAAASTLQRQQLLSAATYMQCAHASVIFVLLLMCSFSFMMYGCDTLAYNRYHTNTRMIRSVGTLYSRAVTFTVQHSKDETEYCSDKITLPGLHECHIKKLEARMRIQHSMVTPNVVVPFNSIPR